MDINEKESLKLSTMKLRKIRDYHDKLQVQENECR